MQQVVLPIKDSNVLKEVQDTLLNNFKAGQRNYTIFQVDKATLLRVSDVMRLRWADVFNENGTVRQNTFIHDKKNGQDQFALLKTSSDGFISLSSVVTGKSSGFEMVVSFDSAPWSAYHGKTVL